MLITWRIGDVDFPDVAVLVVVAGRLCRFSFDGHDRVNDGPVGQEVDDRLSVVLKTILSAAVHETLIFGSKQILMNSTCKLKVKPVPKI